MLYSPPRIYRIFKEKKELTDNVIHLIAKRNELGEEEQGHVNVAHGEPIGKAGG